MDSILSGRVRRGDLWFRLSCAALSRLQIARRPNCRISKGKIVNKMLENKKKRERERERERERKVVATGLVRSIRQTGKWEEVVSGRPWGLYKEHFTHKEHPSVLIPGSYILATNEKGRWEEEEKKTKAVAYEHSRINAILRIQRRKENVIGRTRRFDLTNIRRILVKKNWHLK